MSLVWTTCSLLKGRRERRGKERGGLGKMEVMKERRDRGMEGRGNQGVGGKSKEGDG